MKKQNKTIYKNKILTFKKIEANSKEEIKITGKCKRYYRRGWYKVWTLETPNGVVRVTNADWDLF